MKAAKINTGIFFSNDIALLLDLPTSKVSRWLNEYWADYLHEKGRNKRIGFSELIEFYVFYMLRERGISPQKITTARESLKKLYKTNYPFASSNLLTYGTDIKFKDSTGLLNADLELQYNISDFIEPFSKKIEYNKSEIAQRFYPAGKDIDIVVDPKHKFGSPVIKGTNTEVYALQPYIQAGEEYEFIADLFNLTVKQINDVSDFLHL
jgi:uncharacterized protein (DUF433 family)